MFKVQFNVIFKFIIVICNTYYFNYLKIYIDTFLVVWLHFRGKLLLQDHSHMSTTVNKSWPKTKNTGQCGRYTARYWKWQMVFHVPFTFSAVASHLLLGLQGASPFSITRVPVPADGRGRSAVGPPTSSKGVFSYGSVSWGHGAANLSGGRGPWKIYAEVMSKQKVLSRRPVLERKHDRVQCPRMSSCAPLLSLLLCQKCFTLLCRRGERK